MHDPSPTNQRTGLLGLLLLGLGLPTFVTWVYFEALDGSTPAFQQTAYGMGKAIQFLLPLVAWRVAMRVTAPQPGLSQPNRDAKARYRFSAVWGAVSGLLIGAATIVLYFYVLLPSGWMDGPRDAAREKLASMGLNSKPLLLAAAVFYALVHSGLEEYYWRWFIFKRLTGFVSLPWAVCISSLGFMAHHVIVLARYFGWDSVLTIVFALGVAIGGAVWAELYRHSNTLVGSWLSHALVDAAIFVVGFHLAFVSV